MKNHIQVSDRYPTHCTETEHSALLQVKESKEKERLERRLLEELFKMFMDADSFYYSLTYDLTNTVQRQSACEKTNLPLWKKVIICLLKDQPQIHMGIYFKGRNINVSLSFTNKVLVLDCSDQYKLFCMQSLRFSIIGYKRFYFYMFQVDDRFFWNKHMIEDLINLGVSNSPYTYGFLRISMN